MANMSALTECYGNPIKAYLLIPIVGRMFADFINLLVITVFSNLLWERRHAFSLRFSICYLPNPKKDRPGFCPALYIWKYRAES